MRPAFPTRLRPLVPLWLANFWAGLAGLAILKIASMCVSIFSVESGGYEPEWKLVLKFFVFIGADIFGAALLATLLTAICAPLALRDHPRAAIWISGAVQILHGILGTISFFTVIFMGGPLNKTALDLFFMGEGGGGDTIELTLLGSVFELLNVETGALFVLVIGVTIAGLLLAPRIATRLRGRRGRAAVLVGAALAAFNVGLLPFLMSGEIGGIRIYTYGLEKSPITDLAWSYVRSLDGQSLIDEGLIDDEFRFDFSSEQPGEEAEAPLARAVPRKTNVLMIALESVGQPYLAGDADPMPFLRTLGERPGGHVFANNYSTWSLTTKAFFSVFCSELPYPTYKAEPLINPTIPCVSLTEALHAHGYRTLFVTGQNMAYDRQMRFYRHRALDLMWDRRNMPGVGAAWLGDWGADDRFVSEKVVEAIRQGPRDQPFFAFWGMTAGHYPFNCCKEHVDNPIEDRERRYARALGFIDDRIRELLERLEREGLADDLLIVVFSDHGDGHGRYGGRNAWQPVIQVPLVLNGPQLGAAAGRSDLTTSAIDVAPTVLGLLGLPVPCTMKGRNLVVDREHRVSVFGARPPRWQLGVTDGRWKFIWEDRSLEMLFDLSVDPGEYRNLAKQHPDEVARYRHKVEQWSAFSANLIENYAAILERSDCRADSPGGGR